MVYRLCANPLGYLTQALIVKLQNVDYKLVDSEEVLSSLGILVELDSSPTGRGSESRS